MSIRQQQLAAHNRSYRRRRDVKWPKAGFPYQRDPNRVRLTKHVPRERQAPHILSPLAASLRALISQEQTSAVAAQRQRISVGFGHNTRGYRMGRANPQRSVAADSPKFQKTGRKLETQASQ